MVKIKAYYSQWSGHWFWDVTINGYCPIGHHFTSLAAAEFSAKLLREAIKS